MSDACDDWVETIVNDEVLVEQSDIELLSRAELLRDAEMEEVALLRDEAELQLEGEAKSVLLGNTEEEEADVAED